MTREKNNQGLILSSAVVAGILGTLSTLLRPKRKKGWTEQAKEAANHLLERELISKNMMLGGVTGGLIGAAAALLLAPKSGAELMKDLAHPFTHEVEHRRSTSRRSSASRSGSRKSASKRGSSRSSSSRSSSHKEGAKAEEGHSHGSSKKKRSPARRRTATAARRPISEAVEKAAETVGV